MSARRFKSRRRLTSEILPLASVVCVAGALAGLFPSEVGGFVRNGRFSDLRPDMPLQASCSFVALTPRQEESVLAAARMSWQKTSTRTSRNRLEMLPSTLPEIPFSPTVATPSRPAIAAGFRLQPRVGFLPPTVAAGRPDSFGRVAAEEPRLPFPRQEMLRLRY